MRVALIRLSSLGDVVLATSVIDPLFRRNCEIAFVTKPDYRPLLEGDPRLSDIIEFSDISRTAAHLREFKPDLIIDLHNNPRSIALTALTDVETLRASKWSLRRRMLVFAGIGDRRPRSVIENYEKLLKSTGFQSDNLEPKVFPQKNGLSWACDFIRGVQKPIAILHLGTRHKLKNWGTERFIRLGELLESQGFSIVMLGDNYENVPFTYASKLTLEQLVGLLSLGDLFIGNDSGPVHISAALGVPSLSIFGPTHPALGFVPRGKFADFITADLACSPCTLHGEGKCRMKRQLCFEKLTPSKILEKAMELYKAGERTDKIGFQQGQRVG